MKIKNPTQIIENENGRNDANIACPNCNYQIDDSHETQEWPGLPAGVKFDPSEEQLLRHLAAKVRIGNARPHSLINDFILTLEEDDGICYTHPENLPGVKQDGSYSHFFHRTTKAYTTGTRKRRRIDKFRWHKTGKTKKVYENGEQIGCKKIMVLHMTSAKGSKPEKTNWVMHQYHLGTEDDEKEGEFVVSKIKCDKTDSGIPQEDAGTSNGKGDPPTPTTSTPPQPPPEKQYTYFDRIEEEHLFYASSPKAADLYATIHRPSKPNETECDGQTYLPDATSLWAGESQYFEDSQEQMVGLFSCQEILENQSCQENAEGTNNIPGLSDCGRIGGSTLGKEMHQSSYCDLANIDFDTPPDGPILDDSQFGSQESLSGWLNNFGDSQ
jgi:hypothetical protein